MQDEIKAQGTEAKVCADIAKRQQFGLNKYGTSVADNPLDLRQWLQHAYEESLDFPIYLKRAIDEIDAKLAKKEGQPKAKKREFNQQEFDSKYLTVLDPGADSCLACAFASGGCVQMRDENRRPACVSSDRADKNSVFFVRKGVIRGA
jgi:hypothetical protein